jgi:hypothetical protein
LVIAVGSYFRPVAHAQSDLTPGMLFGPIVVDTGEHLELCGSFLSEGSLAGVFHFRNLTTGEVTPGVNVVIRSGDGACVQYYGKGVVVGFTRGSGPTADWVSPSNALIGTMSLLDKKDSTKVTVLGVAKLWLRGL